MKFLKWLGIIVVCIIALILIIPLFLPSNFHVERSVIIERSPERVFQTAIDMSQRAKWDPWIEMESGVKMEVTMKPEIIGSGYYWKGDTIGEGRITIKEFVPNELIKSEIEFIAPRSSKSDVIWTFEENKKGTKITWAFEGTLSYPIEKWMGLFMEQMMAGPFEKGLSNFKSLVESKPELQGRTGEISEVKFKGLQGMVMKDECNVDELSGRMIKMYSSLMRFLRENDEDIDGHPFTIYHYFNENEKVKLECGLPVSRKLTETENIKYIEIPAGNAVMASHFGHFSTVQKTYAAIEKYVQENNLKINGIPFELYITDPMKEPDQSKWETNIYFPIK